MERSSLESWKILSILRRFSTLALALSLFCFCFALIPSPASALDFDVSQSGVYTFTSGTFYNTDGGSAGCSLVTPQSGNVSAIVGGTSTLRCVSGGMYARFYLYANRTIPANSIVTLYYSLYGSQAIPLSPYDNSLVVLDNKVIDHAGQITLLTTQDTSAFRLKVASLTTGGAPAEMSFTASSFVVLTSEAAQAEKDKAEQEQTGSDSESSADSAQSDVSDASKGIFDVLGSFTGAITGASPGSCNISGNFGFFDAGSINLCSGSSKITPITNVVGAVMLIGLTIPACVTLLHRFVDLYNEVMN